MRDFLIRALDKLIGVVVVIMALGVVIGAVAVMAGGAMPGMDGMPTGGAGGVLAGLFVLVAGLIYVIFVGGFLYLGLGIYHNTRRTAELLESRSL